MSIDPLTEEYDTWSPYAFSGNRVIDSRELEGLEPAPVNKKDDIQPGSFKYAVGMFVLNVINAVGGLGATVDGGKSGTFEQNLSHVQSGGLFIIDNSLFIEGVMEINRAPSDGEFKPNYAKGTVEAETKVANVNGNSKASTNSQHGYEITNETKGERHKVGVSGGELNKNGTSRRANSQVNSLNNQGGDTYSAKVKVKDVPSRTGILNWEQKQVDTHYENTGTTAPGQKRPKPTGT